MSEQEYKQIEKKFEKAIKLTNDLFILLIGLGVGVLIGGIIQSL